MKKLLLICVMLLTTLSFANINVIEQKDIGDGHSIKIICIGNHKFVVAATTTGSVRPVSIVQMFKIVSGKNLVPVKCN